jgi:hypothetical protein
MAGLGFAGELDGTRLDVIERAFAERGARLQAEVSTLAHPSVHATLSRRGYVLQGFEHVLGRRLTMSDGEWPVLEGFELSLAPIEDFARWSEAVITAFEHPDMEGVPGDQVPPRDVLERVIVDMAAVASMRRYLAWMGSEIAGGASLRIDGGIAQLCGAATLPRFRRHGVQTGFLRARLADAARAGCDLAVVTTAPGSKSQENVQRQGFSLLYGRALLVKMPAGRQDGALG